MYSCFGQAYLLICIYRSGINLVSISLTIVKIRENATVSVRQFITFRGFACLLGTGLIAQEFRATLSGLITDPSGSGVPAAKVTVKNLATNEEQSQNSNQSGEYSIPFLVPGNYSIRVE